MHPAKLLLIKRTASPFVWWPRARVATFYDHDTHSGYYRILVLSWGYHSILANLGSTHP